MRPTPPSRRHRATVLTIGFAASILMAVGITGATADSATTDVAITPLTPAKVVTTGAYVGPGKTYAFLASSGATTVPTNASVVRLAVTVKGTGGGTLSFAPLGEPGSASPTKVTWAAGGTGTGTVKVNVGVSNKVVVTNTSPAAATVGITINGYSMQTTAAGINGSGGTSGQVLTNNGNGTVAWKTPAAPPVLLKVHVGAFGGVESGNATSATRNSVGIYRVDFGRNLTGCAITGSVGSYGGGQFTIIGVVGISFHPGDTAATVRITRADNLVSTDSDFFLTGIC